MPGLLVLNATQRQQSGKWCYLHGLHGLSAPGPLFLSETALGIFISHLTVASFSNRSGQQNPSLAFRLPKYQGWSAICPGFLCSPHDTHEQRHIKNCCWQLKPFVSHDAFGRVPPSSSPPLHTHREKATKWGTFWSSLHEGKLVCSLLDAQFWGSWLKQEKSSTHQQETGLSSVLAVAVALPSNTWNS